MKNTVLILFTVLTIFSCHPQSSSLPVVKSDTAVYIPVSKPTLNDAEIKKYHDAVARILNSSLLKSNFNGAVLVAKNGTVVYEKYVGVVDPRRRNKDSLTAETPFQIASTGKTLTGAAVLKLVEQGKINLATEVSSYFPGFPYAGVTIKTLLNHRSGLPNYLYYMEKGKWKRTLQATNTDILNTLINWKPAKTANPDRKFSYCNTNYVLLALLVEKVSGLSFPQFMKQTFFDPMGMTNSFVIGPNEQAGHLQSYRGSRTQWAMDFSDGPYGDKNIYSTPRDLLKWDQALYEGNILSQQTLDAAFTPYSNEKPGTHNYGLGWRMLDFPSGKKIIYHNGHWHGFNSAFARLIDEKATIIIVSNNHNAGVYLTSKKLYEVFGNYNRKVEREEE